MIITTQDYGQFLINGVNNYTGTYFSKIVEGLEHDSVWRHLNGSKLPSKVIWERVSEDIIYSSKGYLMFDDSVLDKSGSKKIELARWQYSGTEHDTVMGVGVVNCVYYNPELDRYWVIDARIYQPDEDGKKKYEHLQDMMLKAIERGVIFNTVLMDTWYAITRIIQWINELGYKFVCPIRSNRQILDRFTDPEKPSYKAVKELPWDKLEQGTEVKLKQCSLKVNLFQLSVYPNRTDYVSLLMIKQYVHLRTLQRHAHLDGRLNNIIVKLNKLQALLSANLEILKLSASILLPLFSLGLLCMLRLSLEK